MRSFASSACLENGYHQPSNVNKLEARDAKQHDEHQAWRVHLPLLILAAQYIALKHTAPNTINGRLTQQKYVMDHKNREELLATHIGSEHDPFAVQINTYDRYQSTTTPLDRPGPPLALQGEGYSFHHVPVVRIFGSLPTGHNITVHVHGAFPYIYIPWEKEDCFELQLKLEAAVALSLKRNKENDDISKEDEDLTHKDGDKKTLKYIAHVSICKGVPFYGYHIGFRPFFKIYLLNPSYSNRVSDLLREGKALGRKVEVYESHIAYGLQFLTDYNLFGCGWLRLHDLFIRTPILLDDDVKTDDLVEYMMGFSTTNLPRTARTALEIDTSVQFILNRNDLQERHLHNDFNEKLGKTDMVDFVYIQSTKDLWKDSDFQRKLKGEKAYSTPTQYQRDPTTKWVEAEENSMLFDYIKGVGKTPDDLSFRSFIKDNPALENIPTAFQSISELYYEPHFDDEEDDGDAGETTQGEVVDDDDPTYGLLDINDNYNAELQALENLQQIIDEDEDDQEDEDEDEPNILETYIPDPLPSIKDPQVEKTEVGKEEHEEDIYEVTNDVSFIHHMPLAKRTYSKAFDAPSTQPKLGSLEPNRHRHIYRNAPPLNLNFEDERLPKIQYIDPFYMEPPHKPFINAGKKFKLSSKLLEYLPSVSINGDSIPNGPTETTLISDSKPKTWTYAIPPPSFAEVADHEFKRQRPSSQINVKRSYKFDTQRNAERRPDGSNNLTVIIAEIFVPTRGDLKPDPNQDEIVSIMWRTMNGDEFQEGMLCLKTSYTEMKISNLETMYFGDESVMLEQFCSIVCGFDPDIIAGYEVHASSWGYIIDRSRAAHDYDFLSEISRVTFKSHNKMGDHWGYTHTSSIQVCGRHTLNIWRPLKELNLARNGIEYVAYHLLHLKIASFTHSTLTEMALTNFNGVVKHLRRHTEVDARLIDAAEIITKAAEEARLIGIDFNDVFYRGSQYKVESLMTRIAKAENFMMSSPSKRQVRNQKPLECIPMVMEPISQFYNSPLLVLDFQSLYPSIIIAYNYCYSTLLGRMKNYSEAGNIIGTGKVKHPPGLLKLLEEDITLSPNGLMFAKSTVRKSLLAKMLEDLLDTRFMVKNTMKFLDSNMQQLYNNRQLALKLTANVTYGYTSASFSGRMPCSDIADAIVQTGRETLERAIEMIEGDESWGAKVVYGDTDSLFVYLPGRSREEAFKLGKEMADAVTKANPNPVTLKFEKVYHPALLMAKKRYVGYSYEHLDSPAKFDAKGIETVRRDGHPAQQHIVEHCLRTLFETSNITEVKSYVQDQFNKIINNDVSIQDFCFARAVRVGTYKNPPPGAVVGEKKMAQDARAEPQYKERVPYVIVQEPNSILRERARSPEDFIRNKLKLDAEYYITKTLIPPLDRIFTLVGVDVKQWYSGMPKQMVKNSIYSVRCVSCGSHSKSKLCSNCQREELQTLLNLKQNVKSAQELWRDINSVCRACSDEESASCESHDCSVYFARVRLENKLIELEDVKRQTAKFLSW